MLVDKRELQPKSNKYRCRGALKNGRQCIGTSTESSESHLKEMIFLTRIRMEMLCNLRLSKTRELQIKRRVREILSVDHLINKELILKGLEVE